jgi:hypothetical protein
MKSVLTTGAGLNSGPLFLFRAHNDGSTFGSKSTNSDKGEIIKGTFWGRAPKGGVPGLLVWEGFDE